jgi:hypothetical protein
MGRARICVMESLRGAIARLMREGYFFDVGELPAI